MKIWFIKFTTFISTILSNFVYNFHKPIKGIKTKKNLKYTNKRFNIYQRLDVCYHKGDDLSKLKPCIIYFHGGGWAGYSKGIYTTLCKRLSKNGYVVFNANYGLAPLNKMEDIINDCISAIMYVRKIAHVYGGDNSRIVLAGDSAGAHLSSIIVGLINNNSVELPELKNKIKALLLFYGVYDINTMLTSKFPNIRTYGKACLNGKAKDIQENDKYSPINYVDDKFPPCFLASGEIDKLHKSQSLVMAQKLKENNVLTKTLFFKKNELRAMHAYMIFDGLATNVKTLKSVKNFLDEVIS